MDNLTKIQRRKNMQSIRSKDTLPERRVAKELKLRKIYFAKHVESITGKPDFVFRRKKVVVFVDSDFWHGHALRCIMPKSNEIYWLNKIERNRCRDKMVNKVLKKEGWRVLRIWEHDVKKNLERVVQRIINALK